MDNQPPQIEFRHFAKKFKIRKADDTENPVQMFNNFIVKYTNGPLASVDLYTIYEARANGRTIYCNMRQIKEPLIQEVYLMRGM